MLHRLIPSVVGINWNHTHLSAQASTCNLALRCSTGKPFKTKNFHHFDFMIILADTMTKDLGSNFCQLCHAMLGWCWYWALMYLEILYHCRVLSHVRPYWFGTNRYSILREKNLFTVFLRGFSMAEPMSWWPLVTSHHAHQH